MSNNDWVQEGTPRDDAEWTDETDDYGVPVEPAEWDDYSAEQAMPVPEPPVQAETPPAAVQPEDMPVEDVVADDVQPDPVAAEADVEAAPTVELGETPEESEGLSEADTFDDGDAPVADGNVAGQETVFADDKPVAQADDDLTREVAEGIESERADDVAHADQAQPVAHEAAEHEAQEDESFEDEPLEDEAVQNEDPEALAFGRPAYDDAEATAAIPVAAGAAGAVGAGAALPGLYRSDADETQVLDAAAQRRSIEDEAAEEEARAAALQAEREERERRLGMVRTSEDNAERELRPRRKGVGQFGSFGLFVLRLITAAILGVVGYQVLYSIDATADFLGRQPLIPEPRLVSWIIGFTLAAMAVLLVIGLAVRVVGVVLTALGVAALVLVRWGSFSPFVEGMEGFLGDKDLLLVGVGILFLSIGGGRWGVDGAIHRGREEAREAKRS